MHPVKPSQLTLATIADDSDPRIRDVAELDRTLFGPHKSLTERELRDLVAEGGLLFAHVDPSGRLVTEAALMLSASPRGASRLEQFLPSWLGYCDGAAVIPEYRGHALQRELLQAREKAATERGVSALCASVRHANLASIRAMLRSGFVIAADAPDYFGPRAEDARVIMLKRIGTDSVCVESALEPQAPGPASTEDEVLRRIARHDDIIELLAVHSDRVDAQYHSTMAQLLRSDYLGAAFKADELMAGGRSTGALQFARAAAMNGPQWEWLRGARNQLQSVVDG